MGTSVVTHYILDYDITQISPEKAKEIFELLQKELVVVIKKQNTNPVFVSRLVYSMSHIANWQQMVWNTDGNYIGSPTEYPNPWESEIFPVQRVTGEKKEGEYTGIFPVGKLEWHANLNGPTRADGVALQGYRGVEGTVTSWLNTSVALEQMPEDLKSKLEGVFCSYYYNMENWADIPEKQLNMMKLNQEDYRMKILQENVAGVKGMYFYTNNDLRMCNEDIELYEELKEYLFQEQFMYHHEWEVGDIVLSDQLLTLHKRQLRSQEVFENRILHRLTFPISNAENPNYILERNNG